MESNWQRDFFEHRLRPEDDVTGFARYVFMNPYREGLVSAKQEWLWWRCSKNECLDLKEDLVKGAFPQEAWLAMSTEQMGVRVEDVGEE